MTDSAVCAIEASVRQSTSSLPLEQAVADEEGDDWEKQLYPVFPRSRPGGDWLTKVRTRVSEYSLPNAAMYALARFQTLRRAAAVARRATRRQKHSALLRAAPDVLETPDVELALGAIHEDSWCPGFRLTAEALAEVRRFVSCHPFVCRVLGEKDRFLLRDRASVEARRNATIAFADCAEPRMSKTVQALVVDSRLHALAECYLGYPVARVVPRIMASFVSLTAAQDRIAQKQTVFYHYDLDDFRMLIFNFYLTDTDEASGAHVLIPGSHNAKSMHHTLRSLNFPDEEIESHYGFREPVTVCAKAGYGFAEDPFCFHKALVPRSRDRLILQLRFT